MLSIAEREIARRLVQGRVTVDVPRASDLEVGAIVARLLSELDDAQIERAWLKQELANERSRL
jgi:hypothetical protein